jgi:hypothetical protein
LPEAHERWKPSGCGGDADDVDARLGDASQQVLDDGPVLGVVELLEDCWIDELERVADGKALAFREGVGDDRFVGRAGSTGRPAMRRCGIAATPPSSRLT